AGNRAVLGFNFGILYMVIKGLEPYERFAPMRKKVEGIWQPKELPNIILLLGNFEMLWLLVAIFWPVMRAVGFVVGINDWPRPFFTAINWSGTAPQHPTAWEVQKLVMLPTLAVLLIFTYFSLKLSGEEGAVGTPFNTSELEGLVKYWFSNWKRAVPMDLFAWNAFVVVEIVVKKWVDGGSTMVIAYYAAVGTISLPLSDPIGVNLHARFYSFLSKDAYHFYLRPRLFLISLAACNYTRRVVRRELTKTYVDVTKRMSKDPSFVPLTRGVEEEVPLSEVPELAPL
ncbi:exonuclease, partial [Pseudohyphozyma bogoriensis]